MTLEAIDPLPRTRRGWIIVAVTAVFACIAFILVVRFYNVEGGSRIEGGVRDTDRGGLVARLEPLSVDADQGTARVHVTLGDRGSGLADGAGRVMFHVQDDVGRFEWAD